MSSVDTRRMHGVDPRRVHGVDPRRVHRVDTRFRGRAFPGACLLVCLPVGTRSWGVVFRFAFSPMVDETLASVPVVVSPFVGVSFFSLWVP